jgi:DNA topoisomerase-1
MLGGKSLVIVESGAKAKTIAKYLNADKELASKHGRFVVIASFGHVSDLDPKSLSIDLTTFQPSYTVAKDKDKTIKSIRQHIGDASMVFLASDADREGAFIAYQLKEIFGLGGRGKPPYKRMTFTEITPSALKSAVLNAEPDVDMDLVCAQQARRVMDRLVGYKLSPLLWKAFKTNGSTLSAGRVQSAVLNMLCAKEADIERFETCPYWNFEGDFVVGRHNLPCKLYDADKETLHKVESKDGAKALVCPISMRPFSTHVSDKRLVSEAAPPPFTTSSLQQDAYSKVGMGISMTMKVAQELYEDGHITYMRTDSYNISHECRQKIKHLIVSSFGSEYLAGGGADGGGRGGTQRKVKNSQEAHECIRPTDLSKRSLDAAKYKGKHRELYDLIWKRTVASMMKAKKFEEQRVFLHNKKLDKVGLRWESKLRRVVFEGWGAVYGVKKEGDHAILGNGPNGLGEVICKKATAHNVWTTPPARFTDASIVKVMEKEGIGRPSTYAATLQKLQEKSYIEKRTIAGVQKIALDFVCQDGGGSVASSEREVWIGQENNKIMPTSIGKQVDAFMARHFNDVVDKDFTSRMEETLDRIAAGEATYNAVMKSFWTGFDATLKHYEKTGTKEKVQLTGESRNINVGSGNTAVIRRTRFGPVVEHVHGGKKAYIDLRSYFKIFAKDLDTIDEKETGFLMSLPRPMASNPSWMLYYGRYGFYIKNGEDKTASLFPSLIKKVMVPNDGKGLKALLELDCDQLSAAATSSRASNGVRKPTSRRVSSKKSKPLTKASKPTKESVSHRFGGLYNVL